MNGALCTVHHGFSYYFSFARISSALMPSASSFFRTDSASVFFASSAALASVFAFFASSLTISLSIAFSDAFFSFRSAFKVSMLAVIDAISADSDSLADWFSAIYDAKSAVVVLGLFLLPLGRGMIYRPLFLFVISKYITVEIIKQYPISSHPISLYLQRKIPFMYVSFLDFLI